MQLEKEYISSDGQDHHELKPADQTHHDSLEQDNSNIASKENTVQENSAKSRRSSKWTERIPKLVVVSVENGTFVNCSMENKLKTITFKFDIRDVNPSDVASDLVR